ncbi:MAG: CoA-binding protein [Planctomycetota bacterium]|nr:CoA-binding protein [Planctomycetota bacterium]
MCSKKLNCAVVGDVITPTKWANKSLRAHLMAGYNCYPVAPHGEAVEGLPIIASVLQVPVHLHRVSVYVRPSLLLGLLDDIAQKGCDELFLNPGTYNDEVLERAESLGLNVLRGCSIVDVGVSPSSL